MKAKWVSFISINVATLVLSLNHIFNGFPLLYPDSTGYLKRALELQETNHWSNTYAIFLAGILKIFGSVQFIPIIQNLMVALTLYIFCKNFFNESNLKKYFGIIVLLATTSLVWVSTMIMSDIFTPLSILCIILILENNLSKYDRFIIYPILFIAISSHQSHLLTLPIFTFVVVFIKKILDSNSQFSVRNLLLVSILFIFSNLFEKNIMDLCLKDAGDPPKNIAHATNIENVTKSKQNKDISTGYYFVAVRIAESGNLKALLNDYCDGSRQNYLCKETGKYDVSRIRTTPYAKRNDLNQEYISYAKDTKNFVLFSMGYLKTYIGLAQLVAKRGFQLLGNKNTMRIRPYQRNRKGVMIRVLRKINPKNLESYLKSKQNNDEYFNFSFATNYIWRSVWWKVLFPLSFLLLVFLAAKNQIQNRIKKGHFLALSYLIFGHILNVLICGTFSNFENIRYSSRTLWLINLAIAMVLFYGYEYYKFHKNSLKQEIFHDDEIAQPSDSLISQEA